MLGVMHTEKMLWSVSGDWLECSGWTTVVTNSTTTDSFLSTSHICKTRYMHTVSVAAIYLLEVKAYKQCKMVAFSRVADTINSFSENVSNHDMNHVLGFDD